MDLDLRAEAAIKAAKNGDVDRAGDIVIDLISEDWNNVEAHRAWARVLLARGKATDAVAAIRTAASIDPNRADLQFELAQTLIIEAEKNPFLPLANWCEARQAVLAGMELAPNETRAIALLKRVEEHRARVV